MRNIKLWVCVVILSISTLGCGTSPLDPFGLDSGGVADLLWVDGRFSYQLKNKSSVIVFDNREYIRSGDKPAYFVGLSRDGFGVPFDVYTLSKNSVSHDLAVSIESGFEGSSLDVIKVEPSQLTLVDVVNLFSDTPSDTGLLLVLNEFKADTYHRTTFSYDIDLIVYGPNNVEKFRTKISGEKVRKSSKLLPKNRSAEVMKELYPELLTEIFESENTKMILSI